MYFMAYKQKNLLLAFFTHLFDIIMYEVLAC